jgi:hypothetical protein
MKLKLAFPRLINGKMYASETFELPDEMKNHWYIQALVKSQEAVILEEPIAMEPAAAPAAVVVPKAKKKAQPAS